MPYTSHFPCLTCSVITNNLLQVNSMHIVKYCHLLDSCIKNTTFKLWLNLCMFCGREIFILLSMKTPIKLIFCTVVIPRSCVSDMVNGPVIGKSPLYLKELQYSFQLTHAIVDTGVIHP